MNTIKYPITQEYLHSIHGMTVKEAIAFTKEDWFSQKGNQHGISYIPQRIEFLTKLNLKTRLEVDYYLGNATGRRYFVTLRSNVICWGHVSKAKEKSEYQEILQSLKEIQKKANSPIEKKYV